MIAATYNQSDSLSYSHSGEHSFIWKLHRNFHRIRRDKRHRILHRSLGNARFSRKDRTVSNKCYQSLFFQLFPDIFLIHGKFCRLLHCILVHILIIQGFLHTRRQILIQNLNQLSCLDRTSSCRESDFKPDNNIPCLFLYLTGRTFQHFLTTSCHLDDPAFSGTVCLKRVPFQLLCKIPQQIICHSHLFTFAVI